MEDEYDAFMKREVVPDLQAGFPDSPIRNEDGSAAHVSTPAPGLARQDLSEEAVSEDLDARMTERARQIRELASQLTLAEHEERRRIAEVLHDDLQQQLYGIKFQLGVLRRDVAAGWTGDVLDVLGKMQEWIEEGIGITRTLAVQLWPPALSGDDLILPLNWLAGQVRERYGLSIDLQVHAPLATVDAATRVLLYRVVRELLFNVVKHAGTDAATIELREVEGHIVIRVVDEGRGFDTDATLSGSKHEENFGLLTVRTRLQLLGGRMEISSTPGAGTVVTITAPIANRP